MLIPAKPVKRISWKEGKVLAVETEKDVWALCQMLFDPYVAFFDKFRKNHRFSERDWENTQLLLVEGVTRGFFRDSNVVELSVSAKEDVQIPDVEINDALLDKSERVIFWGGTKHERRLHIEKSGTLVKRYPTKALNRSWPQKKDILKKEIALDDDETIDAYPFAGLGDEPLTNWRLYLCYKLKRNVDPLKDIAFRRDLPLSYKKFVDYMWPDDHF